MSLTPLFNPAKAGRPMRVAAFMSGTGTNILKLIELEKILRAREGTPPFEVVFIFSDRSDGTCRGERIAFEKGIPYFSYDIRSFYRLRGLKRSLATPEGVSARKEFDAIPLKLVRAFQVDVIALGGYMSVTTLERCVNVHPADLSILDSKGRRKYVGDHAVLDAIEAGEEVLRSSTLWTDQGVDTGPLLMVSRPVPVELPEPLDLLRQNREKFVQVAEEHQQRLKEIGDWKIFPRTIEMIARGRFWIDENRRVYVDGQPVPKGYRE
ncbi:MAG: formyl transferase [Deltaproteobacteria bacterium]|nr:formyl transferase [Deltaproteobacteria bacterium]